MPTAPAPVRGPLGKARNPWISILLFVVTLGIYGLVWAYKVFDELKQHTGQGIGGVAGLLIQIFVGVVNAFLLPSEIRNAYEGDGLESPVTPVVGFWILLPIVGAIVWYVKVQNAMNAYWVSKGAPPA
ncbi:MAG: DUF4234 domain-containing protein [Acidimicrobiia bacterium]|nr:DUF4234 domain-containing protein [Acidimicrobiia bacterium]